MPSVPHAPNFLHSLAQSQSMTVTKQMSSEVTLQDGGYLIKITTLDMNKELWNRESASQYMNLLSTAMRYQEGGPYSWAFLFRALGDCPI